MGEGRGMSFSSKTELSLLRLKGYFPEILPEFDSLIVGLLSSLRFAPPTEDTDEGEIGVL